MSEDAGFWEVLGALVPLGLVGAFSWLPVTGVVILLLAPGGRSKVPAFLAGRVVGLAVVTVAFVAGARALPSVPHLDGPVVASVEVLVEEIPEEPDDPEGPPPGPNPGPEPGP